MWTQALLVLEEVNRLEPGRDDIAVLVPRYQQSLLDAAEKPEEEEDAG